VILFHSYVASAVGFWYKTGFVSTLDLLVDGINVKREKQMLTPLSGWETQRETLIIPSMGWIWTIGIRVICTGPRWCEAVVRRFEVMDVDTVVLLAVTACAYCWFVSFGIREQRKEIKARKKERIDQLRREERLKKLFGRL